MARAWPVGGLGRRARFRDAAGRVILTRWRETMSYRDPASAGDDARRLKAMRVSARRLRAAMEAFEGAFPTGGYRPLVREVTRLADALGRARDLDVAVRDLEEELPALGPEERVGLEGLIARLRAERAGEDEAIAALVARLDREGFPARLEAFVAAHTGVMVDELALGPAGR